MTVAALSPTITYTENGVTLVHPVPFRFEPGTLVVKRITASGVVLPLVAGIDYAASGGETDSGGSIVKTSPGIDGNKIRIERFTPRTQAMDYTTGDTFPAESHEKALDRLTLIEQEQDAGIASIGARALRVPEGETVAEFPKLADRVGKASVVGHNADGVLQLLDGADFKGDPGGNVLAAGLFTAMSAMTIPVGVDMVQSTGYSVTGNGSARYIYDVAVNAAYVTANPRTSFISANGRGFRLAMDQFITPQMLGAIGDDNDAGALGSGAATDDLVALNAWLQFITTRKAPLAALVGNFKVTGSFARDVNYGDGGFSTDMLYTSNILCHARIRGVGAFDHLMSLIKMPHANWIGNLHLMGKQDGQGTPHSTRTINTGLYTESCGHMNFDLLHITGFVCYGHETGPTGTNSNFLHIKHLEGSRVGSGPVGGSPSSGQVTTFSARVDSGLASDFGQRSKLTVAALPPAYMDGSGRTTIARINGSMVPYIVKAIDRVGGKIDVVPWLPTGVTTGTIEYFYGKLHCARGTDANLINIGTLSAQGCGGALELNCLYPGDYRVVHCEFGGIGLQMFDSPFSGAEGMTIGRLYCEGLWLDILQNAAGCANMHIECYSPPDFAKVRNGFELRDGAGNLSALGGMPGLQIGGPDGTLRNHRKSGTTILIDPVVSDRQIHYALGANLNIYLQPPNTDIVRAFLKDVFRVHCTTAAAGGGCTLVTFYPSVSGTVNGGASAAFGPFTSPKDFSIRLVGSDWLVNVL